MSKNKTTIIYPTDPLGTKVGGTETFIKGFIEFAPDDIDIEFVGITSNQQKRPSRKWVRLKLGNKEFNFYPLFFEKDENRKTFIPLSLRFTFAAKFSPISTTKRVLFFHRIEPALVYRKINSPKIAVIHNDIQNQTDKGKSESLWSIFPRIYFTIESRIFISLDNIYTVSRTSLDFYESKYPNQINKFCFMPTWADPDVFYPSDKSKNYIRESLSSEHNLPPSECKWILYVGRLQEQKAPLRLINSFYEYYKKNKKVFFILIGEGNLRAKIEKHVKELNIENNVFLMGNMRQQMLVKFYRASDVFLLASNFEGMPMCVLEALGCGLPVVTTNVGEVKKVVKNNFSGEVVGSFSPEIISQLLGKVLNNPDLYLQSNCVASGSEYTPQKVLKPIYERIRTLCKKDEVV